MLNRKYQHSVVIKTMPKKQLEGNTQLTAVDQVLQVIKRL